MNMTIKSGTSLLSAVCASVALLGAAVPMHASAQEQQAPVDATESMTVVRDAATGKMRPPTADEHAALSQATKAKNLKARPAAAAPTLQKFHKSGAQGARLTDEFMSSSVAVRNADGSISRACVEAHAAGDAAAHAAHAAPTSVTE